MKSSTGNKLPRIMFTWPHQAIINNPVSLGPRPSPAITCSCQFRSGQTPGAFPYPPWTCLNLATCHTCARQNRPVRGTSCPNTLHCRSSCTDCSPAQTGIGKHYGDWRGRPSCPLRRGYNPFPSWMQDLKCKHNTTCRHV